MSCGNNCSCKTKSCARFYSNVSQTFEADSSNQLIVAGEPVVLTGNAITAWNTGYEILKTGIYRISGDVVVTATAAGEITFQVYLDGVLLPCTVRQKTMAADEIVSIHTETDIDVEKLCPCNNNANHRIVFVLVADSAVTGTINRVCTGITKLD